LRYLLVKFSAIACRCVRESCFVNVVACQPTGESIQRYQVPELFDHLIREREQLRRNFEAKRLGGIEIDDQMLVLDGSPSSFVSRRSINIWNDLHVSIDWCIGP
jgi:hypothetical protein